MVNDDVNLNEPKYFRVSEKLFFWNSHRNSKEAKLAERICNKEPLQCNECTQYFSSSLESLYPFYKTDTSRSTSPQKEAFSVADQTSTILSLTVKIISESSSSLSHASEGEIFNFLFLRTFTEHKLLES